MRWTRCAQRRSAQARTAKSCGPDPPTLGSSLRMTSSQATAARKPGTPRRTRISRQPIAQGTPVVPAALSLLACAKCTFLCTQGSRVRPASGVPCALFCWRDDVDAKLGQFVLRERRGVPQVPSSFRGAPSWREPGIHTPDSGYGFRARRFAAPRNDGSCLTVESVKQRSSRREPLIRRATRATFSRKGRRKIDYLAATTRSGAWAPPRVGFGW
jgi:hypothetical protein